jgi:transposase
MPWKASSVMEERLRFVARLLDGEAMTDVCRDFGLSRKTGYKIFDRYKEHGLSALSDRSRRPVRYANQLPQQVESLIVRLKAEKPHWGARKIRELLVRRLGGDVRVPAKSTIHAVLDRHGLVKRGGGPRHRARGTPLSEGAMPNDLWCADFKGEFKLRDPANHDGGADHGRRSRRRGASHLGALGILVTRLGPRGLGGQGGIVRLRFLQRIICNSRDFTGR